MPTVIHINENIEIKGGVEVYIAQLQPLLRGNDWRSEWVSILLTGNRLEVISENTSLCWEGKIDDLGLSPIGSLAAAWKCIFHVHSLSSPKIMESLFAIAPVVRTMHEPRMLCPGQGKFWLRSERVCERPFGVHCLLHAYTEKCCNRHPKRLIYAYENTRYEIEVASHKYAAIIANSNYIRDEALKAGVCARKIQVLNYFTPALNEVVEVTSNNRVLYIGRLSKTKGVHYLLQSIARVIDKVPDVRVDILGDGSDRIYFEEMARELKLQDIVTFHGWASREEIGKALRSCSIVAFPSIYPEAFGIVGIEAMICGKPIVGFDTGGVSDWLEDSESGYLVENKNYIAMADRIVRLLESETERARLGKAARNLCLNNFTPDIHLQKLLCIYSNARLSRKN